MSAEFQLRRGEAGDAGSIRDLTRAAYAKWVPVIGREPKPMRADYDEALRTHRFDLLYVRDLLAGLIETDHEGDRLLVVNVAVAPEFHGQGLGSQLMMHAEGLARSLGCTRIWLYTGKLMAENVRLYLKLGYTIDREEEIDNGIFRLYMSKKLAGGDG
ncbi:MAG: GNAT family N-acetyltransferase [Sphingomonadales bacterium]